ncbi:MAG: PilZ domain-containing protein [Synechococcaceae bacterium WB6_3B_236]|nr:PilZ domain-containing protein [Synechococcaceae bacterium WB6_3B_236]
MQSDSGPSPGQSPARRANPRETVYGEVAGSLLLLGDASAQPMAVNLADWSGVGASVLGPAGAQLRPGQLVLLRLGPLGPDGPVERQATVCWCETTGWVSVVGLAFSATK